VQQTLLIRQTLEAAAASFQNGQLAQSKALIKEVLRAQPNQPDALQLLAFIAIQEGQHQGAIGYLKRAVAQRPDDVELQNNLGNLYKATGDYESAKRCYLQALRFDPKCFAAYYNLGNTLAAGNLIAESIDAYRKAITLNPDFADAHYNLAIQLKNAGLLSESIAEYKQTLQMQPGYFDAYINLGSAILEAHEIDESIDLQDAVDVYQQAQQLRPESAELYSNLGITFTRLGKYLQAQESFSRALLLDKDFLEARNNLGVVERLLGKSADAVQSFNLVISRDPSYAAAHRNLGNTLASMGRHQDALTCYDKALALSPNSFETTIDAGVSNASLGNLATACTHFRHAQQLKPESIVPLWADTMSSLPNFFFSIKEIEDARQKYTECLQHLVQRCDLTSAANIKDAAEAVGLLQPFFLNLQCLDNKNLQETYGNLVHKIMSAAYPQWSKPLSMPAKSARIRVGIVSRHFSNHSDWKILISGWLKHLSRQDFEFFGYSNGSVRDTVNEEARKLFDHYREGMDFAGSCQQVQNDNLHILLYPEIGQDPTSLRMAALRLAPVQCASWGVPQTTGLPTIDYFLSSDLMEPENGQQHYVEKLIRLPNLSSCYQSPSARPDSSKLASHGVREDATRYLCVNSLLKYLPQFDSVFPRIAKQVPNAQFLFIGKPAELSLKMQQRLQEAFQRHGMQACNHVVFLPPINLNEFAGLVSSGHVYLDSLDFSGCNTTLETLEHCVPVVTMPGLFMRGRQSSGILQMIGLTETIASSVDEYVELAIRLGLDASFHASIKEKISGNRKQLYGDKQCIEALENFLKGCVA
jgi:protein O-GlcNAc transferase